MSRLANLLQRLRGQANEPMRDDVAGAGPVADVRFQIPNMVCEGCAEKLDGALRFARGRPRDPLECGAEKNPHPL